jgi:hypothetical protein
LVGKSTKRVTIYIHEEKRTDLPIINHPETTTKGGIMKNASCRQMVRSSIMVALLAAFVAAAPTGASAANKLIVQDNSVVPVDKFVVTDTGKIGVGTNTPATAVHTKGGTFADTQVLSHYVGTGDITGAGGFLAYRNNLPSTNSGLPKAGDRIGYMLFGSYASDGVTPRNAAGLVGYAEKDWTDSTIPAYFLFEVATDPPTLIGSGRVERMRINSAGNVGIGTKTPAQRLEVNGGVRLNTADVKPVCDATTRGTMWLEQGATDTLYVCGQLNGASPAWRTVTLN